MNSWKDDLITTSPWLHASALPAIREALRLRLRLMPYLYSAMRAAHESHAPVLSPTFVPFEDDPASFADTDALMVGAWLLAAPVTREGAREVEVYLPRGPEGWRDFWTGQSFASGQFATIAAPLERLLLLAPAGAIIATTDSGDDYSRLHDESSRALRVFPGVDAGQSTATLYEDDGISIDGASTRLTITLDWTLSRIRVALTAAGDYPLPYRRMRVVPPDGETRRIELSSGDGVELFS
jgi:alpha-glucosidase